MLATALGAYWASSHPISADTGWLLYVAERTMEGARLYRDLLEVNPPVIIGLKLPIVAVAGSLDITPAAGFPPYVGGIAAVSLAVGCRIARVADCSREVTRRLLLVFLVGVFFLSGSHFGQREHLFFTLSFPYVMLAGLRRPGFVVSAGIASMAGILAGIGFALKPHFLILWITVEAGHRLTGHGRLVRPENVAIGGICVVTAVAVIAFFPEYIDLVQRFSSAYLVYFRAGWMELLSHPVSLIGLGAITLASLEQRSGMGPMTTSLAAAVAACLVIVVLQGKGWTYHFFPVLGYSFLLLGWLLVSPISSTRRRLRRVISVAACLGFAALLTGGAQYWIEALYGPRQQWQRVERLSSVIREHGGERKMVVGISRSHSPAFPAVNYAEADWGLRLTSLWPLASVEGRAGASLNAPGSRRETGSTSLHQWVRETVVSDVLASRPDLAIVEWTSEPGFDRTRILRYLLEDKDFRDWWDRYRLIEEREDYLVFRRRPVR